MVAATPTTISTRAESVVDVLPSAASGASQKGAHSIPRRWMSVQLGMHSLSWMCVPVPHAKGGVVGALDVPSVGTVKGDAVGVRNGSSVGSNEGVRAGLSVGWVVGDVIGELVTLAASSRSENHSYSSSS